MNTHKLYQDYLLGETKEKNTPLCFTALSDTSTIKYSLRNGMTGVDLKYSLDGKSWANWLDDTDITISKKEKLYVKGNNPNGLSTENTQKYTRFVGSGQVEVSGNINSLLDDNDGLSVTTLPVSCYYQLFENNHAIVKAHKLLLPTTSLAKNCYKGMFYNCIELITAPKLPATTLELDCYHTMFQNCSSLIEAPELPATTLAQGCYYAMFNRCYSLIKSPTVLPATILTEGCYYVMFFGCSKIQTSPYIMATTLTSNNSLRQMFYSCSDLKNIKIAYTGNFDSNFTDWVRNVSATGDFYYNGSDTTRGGSAIPTGWTVHTF